MKAKRVDNNHTEIINQAKSLGISVQSLHELGKGCPDVLFGYGGINIFAEIKNGNNNLNQQQIDYHQNWKGQICTIRNIDELIIEFLSYSNTIGDIIMVMDLYMKYIGGKNETEVTLNNE